MDSRHWHILGAGSIGSLFACLLDQAGVGCSLVLRPSDPALERGSLDILLREGSVTNRHNFALGSPASAAPIHQLLVCTKAYDLEESIASVLPRLAPDAVIVLLANGLGYQQRIAEQWPRFTVVSGSTTEGAFRATHHGQNREVQRAGRGITWFGASELGAPDWFSDWQELDAHCVWTSDMDAVLWRKLAINCAINPLTALHHCLNGALAERHELELAVRELCVEIATVTEAAGHPEAATHLHTSVMEVIRATANNRSSMLQDISAGRPTEIDYLTGHLVATAERLHITTPRNRSLLNAVRELETRQTLGRKR